MVYSYCCRRCVPDDRAQANHPHGFAFVLISCAQETTTNGLVLTYAGARTLTFARRRAGERKLLLDFPPFCISADRRGRVIVGGGGGPERTGASQTSLSISTNFLRSCIPGVPNALAFFSVKQGRLLARFVQDTGPHTTFTLAAGSDGALAASVGAETWLLADGDRSLQLTSRLSTAGPSLLLVRPTACPVSFQWLV